MAGIERIAGNAPWEPIFGYSRAVKAGEWLALSGTTATDERGTLVGTGQMYVQARQALLNIKAHVERAGLTLADIVRTRVFVTDISRFAEVARAHREILGEAPPASTVVEVRRLVHPDMLVEIEADLYAGPDSGAGKRTTEAAARGTDAAPGPNRTTAQKKPRIKAASKAPRSGKQHRRRPT